VSATDRRPLVLVAVGTDHHPFDRVIAWIDRWLEEGTLPARVIVQHGTAAAPRLAEGHPLLDHETMQSAMAEADLVICHGGPATITEARRHGHLPICVPRDPRLGEHVDEHQQLFARRMAGVGVVRLAETEPQLRSALAEALDHPDRFRLTTSSDRAAELPEAVHRIGEIVRGLTAPDTAGVSPVPVLYVGGLGRSGSTLLERAVAQLGGLVSVGELVHLWERGLRDDELCGCGAAFSACDFWERVGKAAYGGWEKVDIEAVLALKSSVDRIRFTPVLAGGTMPPGFRRRVLRYGDLVRRLYAAVLEVSGAEMVVDSSKHASTAFALNATPGIDLRVLHVVRDSPAVAYAWTKRVERPESTSGVDYMAAWSPGRTVLQWTAANALFELLARKGTPTHRVRYEDFVRAPLETMRGLLQFLDRSADESSLGFIDGRTLSFGSTHTVAGNPMRFRTGPVEVVTDDAWRQSFPIRRQRLVAAVTLPLRSHYGYRSNEGAP